MSDTWQQPSDVPGPAVGSPEKNEQTLAMVCHLLAFCGFTCIPFANIIGPLVLWLIKKDECPFVNDQGKEAVNFQITMALAGIVLTFCYMITIALAGAISPLLLVFAPIVGLAGLALFVANVVFIIIAAMKANSGEAYRYPFSVRLIK